MKRCGLGWVWLIVVDGGVCDCVLCVFLYLYKLLVCCFSFRGLLL